MALTSTHSCLMLCLLFLLPPTLCFHACSGMSHWSLVLMVPENRFSFLPCFAAGARKVVAAGKAIRRSCIFNFKCLTTLFSGQFIMRSHDVYIHSTLIIFDSINFWISVCISTPPGLNVVFIILMEAKIFIAVSLQNSWL